MFSKLRRRFSRAEPDEIINNGLGLLLEAMEEAGYAVLSPDEVGILVTADDLGSYTMTAAGVEDAADYAHLLRTLSRAMTEAASRIEDDLDDDCDCHE